MHSSGHCATGFCPVSTDFMGYKLQSEVVKKMLLTEMLGCQNSLDAIKGHFFSYIPHLTFLFLFKGAVILSLLL